MNPPATPHLSALAAMSTGSDPVHDNPELLRMLAGTLKNKSCGALQAPAQVPLCYAPAVLQALGFQRYVPKPTSLRCIVGYPDWILTDKGDGGGRAGRPVRVRAADRPTPAHQYCFPVGGPRCPNAGRARCSTTFSTPSFADNRLGPCNFCRHEGSEDTCAERNRPFLGVPGVLQLPELVADCVAYERWLRETALKHGEKRSREDEPALRTAGARKPSSTQVSANSLRPDDSISRVSAALRDIAPPRTPSSSSSAHPVPRISPILPSPHDLSTSPHPASANPPVAPAHTATHADGDTFTSGLESMHKLHADYRTLKQWADGAAEAKRALETRLAAAEAEGARLRAGAEDVLVLQAEVAVLRAKGEAERRAHAEEAQRWEERCRRHAADAGTLAQQLQAAHAAREAARDENARLRQQAAASAAGARDARDLAGDMAALRAINAALHAEVEAKDAKIGELEAQLAAEKTAGEELRTLRGQLGLLAGL